MPNREPEIRDRLAPYSFPIGAATTDTLTRNDDGLRVGSPEEWLERDELAERHSAPALAARARAARGTLTNGHAA